MYRRNIKNVMVLFVLSGALSSQAAERQAGLINGKLRQCPDSPNCVSSEQGMIKPILFTEGEGQTAWRLLHEVITAQGGQIKQLTEQYLAAEFKTPVLGFTDDVQARLDVQNGKIHIRSASRTGYYDFGTNSKRLFKLKQAMTVRLNPELLQNIHK